ncbi:MAG: FmdB family zinc ribbon protein [Terriglobia bacterium]
MPIFEYECRDCGARFERIVASHEDEVTCKSCASRRVEQLLSVFAVSGGRGSSFSSEAGPCPCGAPRRGMCGE